MGTGFLSAIPESGLYFNRLRFNTGAEYIQQEQQHQFKSKLRQAIEG